MSILDWIKTLFGKPRKRDISRLLSSSAEDTDATAETEESIEISGGPLKEHHFRRSLRDVRLLPKVKSPAQRLRMAKRKRVMSSTEAARLFGGTMRTRNRNLRDLLTDEEQLNRYGLPVWRTEQDIADVLGLSLKELWYFSIHRQKDQQPHYITFSIPKRSGGRRLIMAPKRRLKSIQRELLHLLIEKLPVSEYSHGFVKGRSIRTGAEPHVGKKYVFRLDLKDFFPSVTFARVRGLLISYGYSFPVATTLAVLMTEAERQPVEVEGKIFHVPIGHRHCIQGAPTSPGLCNSILLRLDRRLAGLAAKYGLNYTRYADDLTFSGDIHRETMHKLCGAARRIIEDEGFSVNNDKTRLMGRHSSQRVTGVVVNDTLGLSRKERKRLRACLHQLQKVDTIRNPYAEQYSRVKGKLAYLSMLNRDQAVRLESKTTL